MCLHFLSWLCLGIWMEDSRSIGFFECVDYEKKNFAYIQEILLQFSKLLFFTKFIPLTWNLDEEGPKSFHTWLSKDQSCRKEFQFPSNAPFLLLKIELLRKYPKFQWSVLFLLIRNFKQLSNISWTWRWRNKHNM